MLTNKVVLGVTLAVHVLLGLHCCGCATTAEIRHGSLGRSSDAQSAIICWSSNDKWRPKRPFRSNGHASEYEHDGRFGTTDLTCDFRVPPCCQAMTMALIAHCSVCLISCPFMATECTLCRLPNFMPFYGGEWHSEFLMTVVGTFFEPPQLLRSVV